MGGGHCAHKRSQGWGQALKNSKQTRPEPRPRNLGKPPALPGLLWEAGAPLSRARSLCAAKKGKRQDCPLNTPPPRAPVGRLAKSQGSRGMEQCTRLPPSASHRRSRDSPASCPATYPSPRGNRAASAISGVSFAAPPGRLPALRSPPLSLISSVLHRWRGAAPAAFYTGRNPHPHPFGIPAPRVASEGHFRVTPPKPGLLHSAPVPFPHTTGVTVPSPRPSNPPRFVTPNWPGWIQSCARRCACLYQPGLLLSAVPSQPSLTPAAV